MSKIDIGIKIDLETFIETKLLIEADSGSGKSWTIRKIAEECSGKVQQIIIDPEGDFITLREKYPFALVSKSGGDIPLNLRYAEALAHKLLETGISVIIDLYEFKQHEREQFVKVFCEALMNAPKSLRHSCLVYLDEAQLFCPEDKRAISTSAVIDLCTRGRKRGLCAILATLRISILNKSAAAQCKNKMMGSTSLPLDQKRVGDELGLRTKEEIRDLRNLGKGEFWAFGPAISKEIVKFKVGQVKTTHIKSGSKLTSAPPTPAAIKKILSKLEDIPEEAEKELATKKQFQEEIKRLKNELKNSEKGDKEADSKLQEKVLQLQTDLKTHKVLANALKKELDGRTALLNKIKGMIGDFKEVKVDPELLKPVAIQQPAKGVPVVSVRKPMIIDHQPRQTNGAVTGGAMRMLKAAAMFHPNSITKTRMAALAGLSHTSGSFSTYKATLKREGLVLDSGDHFVITEEGLNKAGDFEPLPTDPDVLVDMWCGIVGGGASRMLKALAKEYPNELSKSELGAEAGINHTSGSFSTYMATLKRNGLIQVSGQAVKASDELFN
jgi:uncharacterized protein